VARRVSPTERVRARIDELFASEREPASILEDVARLSVRSIRSFTQSVRDVSERNDIENHSGK